MEKEDTMNKTLTLLEECFEGLPDGEAKPWRVGWQFLHWLLTDSALNPAINDSIVRGAIQQCADVLLPLTEGRPANPRAAHAAWNAANAAKMAANVAACAAWKAVQDAAWRSVEVLESVAWREACAAESAACAAMAAMSGAIRTVPPSTTDQVIALCASDVALYTVESVACATKSIEKSAAAASTKMAEKLIGLIEKVQ